MTIGFQCMFLLAYAIGMLILATVGYEDDTWIGVVAGFTGVSPVVVVIVVGATWAACFMYGMRWLARKIIENFQ